MLYLGKNRACHFWICCWLISSLMSCSSETRQSTATEPALDMRALANFTQQNSGVNQVLLKYQLLNTRADILKHGVRSIAEHQERLGYFHSRFKEDVLLLSGTDTIPCLDVHAERLYMDLPYMHFVLVFQHKLNKGDQLLIRDIVYTQKTIRLNIDPKIEAQ